MTEALRLALVGLRLTVVTSLEALAGVTIEQGEVAWTVHMLRAASALRAQLSTQG